MILPMGRTGSKLHHIGSVHYSFRMIARQLRSFSSPSNKLSLLYLSYLTLGLTIPFVLPAHMTQKILNDCPDVKGVKREMLYWAQVGNLVRSGQLDRLERSPEVTARYRKHKSSLRDDIAVDVCKKLQWSLEEIVHLNTVEYPSVADKTSAAFSEASLFKVTANDFPYWFEPLVSHLVIWSKISLPVYCENSDRIEGSLYNKIGRFVKYNLEQRLGLSSDQYCFFINYSRLQSVRGISHIHLLLYTDPQVVNEILSEQFEPYVD